ncbi:MAG: hypothetical protein HGB10_03020 [Coriobacteriia bacterium]|nr:hypothetical protein [Coriobacteriia bacterium]
MHTRSRLSLLAVALVVILCLSATTAFAVGGPTVSGFSPTHGSPGTVVTVTGVRYSQIAGVTAVHFNGTSAVFQVDSDTSLRTWVPAGATTGRIAVTGSLAGMTATSTSDFTVDSTGTIAGTVEDFYGGWPMTRMVVSVFRADTHAFVKTVLTDVAGYYRAANLPVGDYHVRYYNNLGQQVGSFPYWTDAKNISTAGTVTVASGSEITADQKLKWIPTVSGFSPSDAAPGETIMISGSHFDYGTNGVTIGGLSAMFDIVDDNTITATVPEAAVSGKVTVSNMAGTGTSADTLNITAPVITSFTPASGTPGTHVVLTGRNFFNIRGVTFNGTAAEYTVDTDTQITAVVPAGATTGRIAVTSQSGTRESGTDFTVVSLPGTVYSLLPYGDYNGMTTDTSPENFFLLNFGAGRTDSYYTTTDSEGWGKYWSDWWFSRFEISIGRHDANMVVHSFQVKNAGGPTTLSVTTTDRFGGTRLQSFNIEGGITTVELDPESSDERKVEIVFADSSNLSFNNFRIETSWRDVGPQPVYGTVVGGGTGLNRAVVTAFDAETHAMIKGTFTDSDGDFAMTLPQGNYHIRYTASGWPIRYSAQAGSLGDAAVVEIWNAPQECDADLTPVEAPTISSFDVTSGPVGTWPVTVTGTGFTTATSVKLNGTTCYFAVDSDTSLRMYVEPGCTTGKITITTPGGMATSASSFVVIPEPVATNTTPLEAPPGTTVIITGQYFTGATSVSFNLIEANYTVVNDGKIVVTVPAGDASGLIRVYTPGGVCAAGLFTAVTTQGVSGVISSDEGPLNRVVVSLFNAETHAYVKGIFTAADGSYSLTGIPAGAYHVRFTGTTPANLTQYFDHQRRIVNADVVTVAAGEMTPVSSNLSGAVAP